MYIKNYVGNFTNEIDDNGNGKVNFSDLQFFFDWRNSGGNYDSENSVLNPISSITGTQYIINYPSIGDFTQDSKTNFSDLQYFFDWRNSGGNIDNENFNIQPTSSITGTQYFSRELIFPLKVQRSILPPNSQDETQGYIRNRLSLDLTDTNLSSTFLLACELDISGISQTNSINQPYYEDTHVDSTNVTPDENFDTFITFGSFDANDSNYNKPDDDLILPTDSFDSTNNNVTGTASYQFNSSGVRNILWAKRNIALENITNNTEYPIAQIVIKDNENGTFHFIYGKGVLGPDQEGIDIQGVIKNGTMLINNYNYPQNS